MEVLAISLGRNILKPESRDRVRMLSYAQYLDAYHLVVLTTRKHGYSEVVHEGMLHLYPTNSRFRVMMLIDAFCIGRRIAQHTQSNPFVITAQDPLLIGWISFFLARFVGAHIHIQVHGDYFSTDAWCGHSYIRRIERLFARSLLLNVPAIRVVSERIKTSLVRRGVSRHTITVLPIRPELETFLETSHVHRDVSPYTFLYIGRLAPEKNIPRIIRSFALLHAKYPDIHLHIVGEGSEKSTLEKLVATHNLYDAVTFLPWTQAVHAEMAQADKFVLASLHEAYALTLIEAMAVGLPIVTTDVGCVGEVVRDAVHGIVVKGEGDLIYADAMERLMTDVSFRKTCGTRGKETAGVLSRQTADGYARAWVTSLFPHQ